MLAVFFFGKYLKIMILMTNYAKHYASTIYQSLTTYNGNLSGRLTGMFSEGLSGGLSGSLTESFSEG